MDGVGVGVAVAVELLEGLDDIVVDELRHVAPSVRVVSVAPTEVRVAVDGVDDVVPLLSLRTAVAVHLVLGFDVPRPKALLGSEAFGRVLGAVDLARALHPADAYRSLRVNAAGSDSTVMQRLRTELATATGLRDDPDDGDLLVRVRRGAAPAGSPGGGWEVLVRLSPRPLSARPWRVARYEAASNATIAAAMVRLTEPRPTDAFVDLTCGTGTIVIERLAAGRAKRVVGIDVSEEMLELAEQNAQAAAEAGVHGIGPGRNMRLVHHDARSIAELGDTYDVLVANLPWGTSAGSHAENDELYPAILAAAATVARRGARFVVLTHEIRRFEAAIAGQSRWAVVSERRVFQKGHHPRLYVLGQGSRSPSR